MGKEKESKHSRTLELVLADKEKGMSLREGKWSGRGSAGVNS